MGYLLKGGRIINRNRSFIGDLLIKNDRIEKVDTSIQSASAKEIDASGKWIIPGIIDDQVHFREPGLTHKADILSESRAAAAGGVTSFMEMPNTKPGALTQELLQDKYDIAASSSATNYSFFMGASNDNFEEVMKTDGKNVCGVKIFMGSSTGNMLVDDTEILNKLFANVELLIATHCEDEATIRTNNKVFQEKFGDALNAIHHPLIRNVEGCFLSSSKAVEMARKHGTRLHILHISTAEEIALFDRDLALKDKKITSEVCVHHLYFDASEYPSLGNKMKCNPAIKEKRHKEALLKALIDGTLDVIATDHAPHTQEEKARPYSKAPSGLPLVQHSLTLMLDFYHRGLISKEKIVEKMSHAPADLFAMEDRGYLDEGKMADVVVVNPNELWTINASNIAYKCGWSPLEGVEFKGRPELTFVNGKLVYEKGHILEEQAGQRLLFNRS